MNGAFKLITNHGADWLVGGKRLLAFSLATVLVCLGSYASAEALTVYQEKEKFGLKDAAGAVVTKAVYVRLTPLPSGLFVAARQTSDGWRYGLLDASGKLITAFYESGFDFVEGLAVVETKGKKGFIDLTGKVVVPIKFEYVKPFSEGLAAVSVALARNWGFIDKSGAYVIAPKYAEVDSFSEGLAKAKLSAIDAFGFIDKTDRQVLPAKFASVGSFHAGRASLRRLDGVKLKVGYIDTSGELVIPQIYDYVPSEGDFNVAGVAQVSLSGEKFLIDKQGQKVDAAK